MLQVNIDLRIVHLLHGTMCMRKCACDELNSKLTGLIKTGYNSLICMELIEFEVHQRKLYWMCFYIVNSLISEISLRPCLVDPCNTFMRCFGS